MIVTVVNEQGGLQRLQEMDAELSEDEELEADGSDHLEAWDRPKCALGVMGRVNLDHAFQTTSTEAPARDNGGGLQAVAMREAMREA